MDIKMRKLMIKKLTGYAIVFSLLINSVMSGNVPEKRIYAAEKKKEFIVVTEDEETYDKILREYEEDIVHTYEEYDSNDKKIIHMKLDEQQKDVLEDINDEEICIEKNIEFTANGKGGSKNKNSTKESTDWNVKMMGVNDTLLKYPVKNGEGIRVAVMDSGIDFCQDINLVERVNLVEEQKDVATWFEDTTGHGTSIAGVISDINPKAEIYSVKVLDGDNSATLDRVIEGIYWCIDHDINIINMSFGARKNSNALEEAIDRANEAGILVVASAGNDEKKEVEYPGAYTNVIAVGSVDKTAEKVKESAIGEEVEFVAPGDEVLTNGAYGGELIAGGTSVAAAHITGAASVIWQKDRKRDNYFVRGLLQHSAKDLGVKEWYGNGIPDVGYALEKYEEYSKKYDQGNYTKEMIEKKLLPSNKREVETFEDVEVQARWTSGGHKTIITNANGGVGFDQTAMGIVKGACASVDNREIRDGLFKHYTDLVLHGWYNYVSVINYLYEVAMTIAQTDDSTSVTSICNQVGKKLILGTGGKVNESGLKARLKEAVVYMASADMTNYLHDTGLGYNWRTVRALRIIGMVMHVTGDVYAHKTKVPNRVNCTTNAQTDCVLISHLEANITKAKFLRFVKSGMIFNKISKYVTKNYEDDNTFFQRRFIMATQASYWILRNESLGNTTFALDQIFTETAKAVGGASYEETKLAFLNVHIKDVYGMARGAAADEYSFVPYESEYT